MRRILTILPFYRRALGAEPRGGTDRAPLGRFAEGTMLSPWRRPGLSLLELLVVLAILGVLAALLLPTVVQSRQAADRLRCQNNLKQIGLALHNYHDGCGSFPPGFATDSYRYLTWMGRLLPFTEESALWQQTQWAYGITPMPWQEPPHPSNRALALYSCPSDPRMFVPAPMVDRKSTR